jgi:hypothetical protein
MPNVPEQELMQKETALAAEVERLLPDFVNSCRDKANVVIIHQDAFAADYQEHEYALLGKAIKFAGLHGKEFRIIGKNRETLKGSSRPELLQWKNAVKSFHCSRGSRPVPAPALARLGAAGLDSDALPSRPANSAHRVTGELLFRQPSPSGNAIGRECLWNQWH